MPPRIPFDDGRARAAHPPAPVNVAARAVEIVRVGADSAASTRDITAAEEPLEIRLDGQKFVVTMRTPGADHDLASGFLLSEGIVRHANDIADMRRCSLNDNILYVTLAGEATARGQTATAGRRHVTATSACGVCGRRSIDDLMEHARPVESRMSVPSRVIDTLPGALRAAQRTFDQTGGLHAAGLFDAAGRLIRVAEDVGRHNAVDKVLGAELAAGRLPLSETLLFVSGRTSFEIVQKAVMGGVAIVAAVSAPSSLAIELARQADVTLLGFVRGSTFNIYAHPWRIVVDHAPATQYRDSGHTSCGAEDAPAARPSEEHDAGVGNVPASSMMTEPSARILPRWSPRRGI